MRIVFCPPLGAEAADDLPLDHVFSDGLFGEVVGRLHPGMQQAGVPATQPIFEVLRLRARFRDFVVPVGERGKLLVPARLLSDALGHRRIFADERF